MIKKIISGGQTGADQGALDAAIEAGVAHGGWIPKGRKTEGGPLPEKYQLQEMATASYPKRTEKNILASGGTLIITYGLTGGSALTRKLAKTHGCPCLHIDLKKIPLVEAAEKVRAWINANKVEVLNVAGSRESKAPGIQAAVFQTIKAVLI